MPISRRRGARAGPLNRAIEVPDRFADIRQYYDSHGPMTPSAFRAWSDELRNWLESKHGIPSKASTGAVSRIMIELNVQPSVWLDFAATEGFGFKEWEPWKPTSVEEYEPVPAAPDSDPVEASKGPQAFQVGPTYEQLMEQIRRNPAQQ